MRAGFIMQIAENEQKTSKLRKKYTKCMKKCTQIGFQKVHISPARTLHQKENAARLYETRKLIDFLNFIKVLLTKTDRETRILMILPASRVSPPG